MRFRPGTKKMPAMAASVGTPDRPVSGLSIGSVLVMPAGRFRPARITRTESAGQEVLVVGVLVDPAGDELALRHDLLARGPHRVERAPRQLPAETLALVARVDHRVGEDDVAVLPAILGSTSGLAVHEELEHAGLGVVSHLGCHE